VSEPVRVTIVDHGNEVIATATAGAFTDLPRRRRGVGGRISLPRNPASRSKISSA